ncbi:MAG: ATP-binding protein [Candidatus Aureabacteria bacterium]|nr:ATP-binding protein [Candidatus Auribacterota bacterium]
MKANLLGDIRAEFDSKMLDQAFWETADYKTLIDSSDRCVVVGRRGTGKSALVFKLNNYWKKQHKTKVLKIAPEEDQIIGLRDLFCFFGDQFLHIKAGSKLAWRYALYLEIIVLLSNHYKLSKYINKRSISQHILDWKDPRKNISFKIKKKIRSILKNNEKPQTCISELSDRLDLNLLEDIISSALKESQTRIILLADRLDEGYTPDNTGIALVDGFVQSVIDINAKFKDKVLAFVFLRDNIYRAIAQNDQDFSRNIEGQILRLHWDEYNLFNLVCNRLRVVFNSTKEKSLKIWNTYTAGELQNKEGFKTTLRLTLYRPRDILVLLNNAFYYAEKQVRNKIVLSDIENSAKSISECRLNDLHKEYGSIFPSLDIFTKAFIGKNSMLTISEASEILLPVLEKDNYEIKKQQDIAIIENSIQTLQRLYSVGFIGIKDESNSSFIFCHDGKDPSKEISLENKILIHPCYWLALNITQQLLGIEDSEEIYDEYDIEISSISDEQRKKRIGSLLTEVDSIPLGSEGAHVFEDWCLSVIKLIFAGALCNIELHPNKNGLQQRDIVATNLSEVPVWQRIYEDYSSRHIVFEVKNIIDLKAEDYRQINTYLGNNYGSLGFIISRETDNNLRSGKDLNWTRELYFHQKKLVVKLSVQFLKKYLSKLRSPQKHNEANKAINKLIDTYLKKYLIIKSGRFND